MDSLATQKIIDSFRSEGRNLETLTTEPLMLFDHVTSSMLHKIIMFIKYSMYY